MDEGEMGRVCPPLRLTMVMVTILSVIRDRRWLPLGRGDVEVEAIG